VPTDPEAPVVGADACSPPAGFVETPPPVIAPASRLVSRTDRIVIERPRPAVQQILDTAALEDLLPRSRRLPGVIGVRSLTAGPFGAPGSRRLVCLSDGSVALEQVLERRENERFRYVVWNYTSASARAVAYGVGDFRYEDSGPGRTRITWTYSFKLDERRLPGRLGPLGPAIFRAAFLDRAYADLMADTLARMKAHVEGRPHP
jgi:hypothetical protein